MRFLLSIGVCASALGAERLRLEHLAADQVAELARTPSLAWLSGPGAAERFRALVEDLAARDAARAGEGLSYDLPALVAYTCADPSAPEMGPFERRYDVAIALAREQREVADVARLLDQDPDGIRVNMLRAVLEKHGVLTALDEHAIAALHAQCDEVDAFIAAEQSKLDASAESRDAHFTDWGLKTTTLTAFPMKIGLLTDRIVRRLKKVPRQAAERVRRALVVGPGIDVANRHLGPFAPVTTYQPFELQASLLAHGLADARDLRIDCLDINPLVIRHIEGALARAHAGKAYPMTVFAFARGPLAFADVHDYVTGFLGGIDGVTRRSGPARVSLDGFAQPYGRALAARTPVPPDLRAQLVRDAEVMTIDVAIPPAAVERLRATLGDVVVDALPEATYDVILCTNLLVYFEAAPRQLAVANMARALRPGGVLICTDRLVPKPGERVLGLKHIHSELFERFDPQYAYQKD